MEDSRILRIRALIERLEKGEDRAIGVLLGLLEPKETRHPTRWIINSRALPLAKIALRSSNTNGHKRLSSAIERFITKITSKQDSNLIDWVTVDHLGIRPDSPPTCITS